MCGIAGSDSKATLSREPMNEIASQMASTLTHRDPDDAGVWVDERVDVGLGFRPAVVEQYERLYAVIAGGHIAEEPIALSV